MDSQRLILFFVFTMSVFLLYEGWQRDQQSAQVAAVAPVPVPSTKPGPVPAKSDAGAVPSAPTGTALTPNLALPTATAVVNIGKTINVETDLYFAEISTVGGDLTGLRLKQHGGTLDRKQNFVLFTRSADHVYVAQSGLIGTGLPNHQTEYTASAQEYKMADGAAALEIRLEATGSVKSAKTYQFQRNNYVIDVKHELTNSGAAPLEAFAYFQLVRDTKLPDGDSAMVPTYTGAAVYTDK